MSDKHKLPQLALSQADQQILQALQEAVEFGIRINYKALNAGQTLYVEFPGHVPPAVAQAFLQNYKQLGWLKLRLYRIKVMLQKRLSS